MTPNELSTVLFLSYLTGIFVFVAIYGAYNGITGSKFSATNFAIAWLWPVSITTAACVAPFWLVYQLGKASGRLTINALQGDDTEAQCSNHVDRVSELEAERDNLRAKVAELEQELDNIKAAAADTVAYLDSNKLNQVGSGSQLHRALAEALEVQP